MKRGIIILASVLSVAVRAAEPGIEFSGVLTADGKTKIALTNKATGTTRWIDPGGDFNGFVISRYDARDEVVVLQRAGQEFRLPLVSPKDPASDRSPPLAAASSVVSAPPGAALRPSAGAGPSRVPPPPAAVLAPEPPLAPTGAPASAPAGSSGDAAVTRSVKSGETLDSIARDTGLTKEQLQSLNPNVNAGSLQVGQVVRIR